MTPQTDLFLRKARRLLDEAALMLRVALVEAAGRNAYLASFHAAQALIFERTGRTLKTHSGVQKEFLLLTMHDGMERQLRAFLARSYDLKSLADYETGYEISLSHDQAADAITHADEFIAHLTRLIDLPPGN